MRLVLGVCLTLVSACAQQQRWERIDLSKTPGPSAYLQAQRVVLLDQTTIDFRLEGGLPVAYEHTRFRGKILTAEAPRWDRAQAFYNRAYYDLLTLGARVVHLDGQTEEADESKKTELPAMASFELYSDSRVAVLPTATPAVGEVWESEMIRRNKQPKLIGFTFGLEDADPIVHQKVVINLPKGWELDEAFRFSKPYPFAREELPDGTVRYTLERHDIPAHRREPLAGASIAAMLVRLRSWTDSSGQPVLAWDSPQQMSKGVWELIKDSELSNPEIDAVAERIKREVGDDPEARARAAHQWVCEKIQYCAIEIGVGGWVPHPAADVQRLGYGDCKDKAMLLHVLLGKLGIASEPALIYHHQGLPLPFGLPVLSSNFNHAILKVDLPGRSVLTDPTAEYAPFGELPRGDLGADLLPLSASGSALEHSSDHGGAVDELSSVLTLKASDRVLSGKAELSLHGWPANEWRSQLSRSAKAKHVKAWCQLFGDGCQLERLDAKGLEKGARELNVSGELTLQRAVERTGQWWSLRAHRLGDWGYDAPSFQGRTQPVVLRWPMRAVQTVTVQLSPNEEATVPPPVKLDGGFAVYELTWTAEPGALVMKRSLEFRTAVLPPDDYPKVVAFADAVRQAEAKLAVVKPKEAK